VSIIHITPKGIGLDELRAPFLGPITVELTEAARDRIAESNKVITDAIGRGDTVYGVNTGFGKLASVRIAKDELEELQRRVIVSHMTGVGDLLPDEVVRAIMLIKIACLSQGHSGVRLVVVETLQKMLNAGLLPAVPAQGSVGASGDLAPLSHLAGTLLGEGYIRVDGHLLPAREALASAGIETLVLGPKEGVALINGTQASTALALRALFAAEAVLNAGICAGALTMEAVAGRPSVFDARIQNIRRQHGQQLIAEHYRTLVDASPVLATEFEGRRLQDPYSLRCMPQVMGAALDLLTFAGDLLLREANAVSDNPLMFPEDGIVLSGGNFHGQPVAYAADIIALALCEIGSLAERRTAMLMDTTMSGLPPFLVNQAGLNSGFQLAQVTSAALVAENRALATPNSVDSIPTSAGQEDHVSMATHAARRVYPMARNTAYILAVELLSAAQGVDLRDAQTAAGTHAVYEAVRELSLFLEEDRALAEDIERVAALIMSGGFHPHGRVDLTALACL
jgi:histidine ammonia-lyase